MSDLKWGPSPRTRNQLLEEALEWAENRLADGNRNDWLSRDLDIKINHVMAKAKQVIAESPEIEQSFKKDYANSAASLLAVGIAAGMYYREKDDHTWPEDEQ